MEGSGPRFTVVQNGELARRVGEESIGTFRVPLSVSAVSSFVPV
jgi:hypothetical protein